MAEQGLQALQTMKSGQGDVEEEAARSLASVSSICEVTAVNSHRSRGLRLSKLTRWHLTPWRT